MKNNIADIIKEIKNTALQLGASQHAEFETVNHVANMLIEPEEMKLEDNTRRALVNMFIAGFIMGEAKGERSDITVTDNAQILTVEIDQSIVKA